MTGDVTAATGVVEGVLVALADPTRRTLLDALASYGSASATVLAADLPISRQAIVKHLAVLSRAGLVVSIREGREMRYAVRPEPLDATVSWMTQVAARWEARLAAIEHLTDGTRPDDPQ